MGDPGGEHVPHLVSGVVVGEVVEDIHDLAIAQKLSVCSVALDHGVGAESLADCGVEGCLAESWPDVKLIVPAELVEAPFAIALALVRAVRGYGRRLTGTRGRSGCR